MKIYTVNLEIPGKPKAKQRSRKGAFGNWYNPQSKDMQETERIIKKQFPFDPIPAGIPVQVLVTAWFNRPKGKKEYICLNKMDIDNIAKYILDSMNKIVYYDDNQVYNLHIKKLYSEAEPRTEVEIEWAMDE